MIWLAWYFFSFQILTYDCLAFQRGCIPKYVSFFYLTEAQNMSESCRRKNGVNSGNILDKLKNDMLGIQRRLVEIERETDRAKHVSSNIVIYTYYTTSKNMGTGLCLPFCYSSVLLSVHLLKFGLKFSLNLQIRDSWNLVSNLMWPCFSVIHF